MRTLMAGLPPKQQKAMAAQLKQMAQELKQLARQLDTGGGDAGGCVAQHGRAGRCRS